MPVAKVFSHSSKLLCFVMLGRDSANYISALATDSILDLTIVCTPVDGVFRGKEKGMILSIVPCSCYLHHSSISSPK